MLLGNDQLFSNFKDDRIHFAHCADDMKHSLLIQGARITYLKSITVDIRSIIVNTLSAVAFVFKRTK